MDSRPLLGARPVGDLPETESSNQLDSKFGGGDPLLVILHYDIGQPFLKFSFNIPDNIALRLIANSAGISP